MALYAIAQNEVPVRAKLAALVRWFKSVGRYCARLAVKGVLGCQWPMARGTELPRADPPRGVSHRPTRRHQAAAYRPTRSAGISGFVRWRTEQWDADPILCTREWKQFDFRVGARKMRSAVVTACVLIVGTYAPVMSVREQLQHAPAQAEAAPRQRQAQTEPDWQGTPRSDIRHSNTSAAAESAVARRRAELLRPSGGRATDTQPPHPGSGQVPGAVGLLLALALLNGAGAAPPAISQPEIH